MRSLVLVSKFLDLGWLRKTAGGVIGVSSVALLLAACGSSSSTSSSSPVNASSSGSGSSGSTSVTNITFAGAGTPNGVDANVAYCEFSGVCKKYGINLKIVYPPSGGTVTDAQEIANGTYQMSEISGPALFQLYESGVHLLAVGNAYSKSLLGLSVRAEGADASITKPQDLRGKKIGVSSGSNSGQVLDAYMAHFGLSTSDYTTETLDLSALISAFTTGKVDAAVVYPMDTSPQFNASGVKTRNFYFSTVPSLSFLYSAFTVSPTWASSHQLVLKNLMKALEVSTEDAVKDPETAAKDLVKTDPHTAPTYSVTLAQWKGNIPFLQSSADKGQPYMYMASADWQSALNYGETYLKVKPMKPSLIFTNSYVPSSTS